MCQTELTWDRTSLPPPPHPTTPNFFSEGKSTSGLPYVTSNQALYDGAVGARAMHKLQNYGTDEPVHNNKASSFSSKKFFAYIATSPGTFYQPQTLLYSPHALKK